VCSPFRYLFIFIWIHQTKKKKKKERKITRETDGHFCVKYLGRPAVIFSSQKSRKIFFKGKKKQTFSLGALSSPMQSAALYCCCRCCCCCCWCGSLRDGWARWREMGKERLPIPSPLRFFVFSFVLFLGFSSLESNDRSLPTCFFIFLSLWCATCQLTEGWTTRRDFPPSHSITVAQQRTGILCCTVVVVVVVIVRDHCADRPSLTWNVCSTSLGRLQQTRNLK
jgi:hypothetical protein